ncbi:MAG: cysteine--tRNA ligase, partial [Candidatus Omnitrophica bacterium]|nr:cysteine--tRNA ligase [Candidatus Omnitrophota bacterium]
YQVTFVRNVTDVDDKIIQKANEAKQSCEQVAERYLNSYHEALERLGIGQPTEEPKATGHLDAMLNLVSELVVKGAAYEAAGDVYFAVRKFPGYGKLSNRTLDELRSSERGEHPAHADAGGGAGKQDPLDFALWKAAKPGEPSWDSPWGKGRPGWHIECSAMSMKYLGDTFDIHGGGVDLVFPHHENEIAQAQAVGKPFARCWIHNGLLTVNGEKMSKSLGNFVTVEDALQACGGETDVLKMFFLGAHYRSPVNYTVENLNAARQRFDALDSLQMRVLAQGLGRPNAPEPTEIAALRSEFEAAMEDDLNTPQALAVLDKLTAYGNQCEVEFRRQEQHPPGEGSDQWRNWIALLEKMKLAADAVYELGKILGLFMVPLSELTAGERDLLDEREAARKRKDFQRADAIRNMFMQKGLAIEDTNQGPLVRRKR